jgi:uncharacterized protein (TIGR00725 family)
MTHEDIQNIDAIRNQHLKIKICVSGAADTTFLPPETLEIAKVLGREIANQGAVLTTGATTGFPLWVAKAAKEAGGFSLGLSPAETEREHVDYYKLPLDYMDFIIYTGQGYPGRDILLTRTSDAIVVGPGRIGTFHEFTVAFEDRKPLGVLEGPWDTDEILHNMINSSHRDSSMVIFDKDPKTLVSRLIEMAKAQKKK